MTPEIFVAGTWIFGYIGYLMAISWLDRQLAKIKGRDNREVLFFTSILISPLLIRLWLENISNLEAQTIVGIAMIAPPLFAVWRDITSESMLELFYGYSGLIIFLIAVIGPFTF